MKLSILLLLLGLVTSCQQQQTTSPREDINSQPILQEPAPVFGLDQASQLIELPLACFEKPYPYKLGQVLESAADLKEPRELHPVFYGCFDWHSAVHGYWSMVVLVKHFPNLPRAARVKELLVKNLTAENILIERAYFEKEINKPFERMYGWAWLLKLDEELTTWEDPLAESLAANLQPLTDIIVQRYKEFLPLLVYPVRVGEHTNTAFGLSFAYDYALTSRDVELQQLIAEHARKFYEADTQCPISWEPSGYDFLSPCLEEMNIMRRVLPAEEFTSWLSEFMPQLQQLNTGLEPVQVSDRTDGKLVHLDGLNFSRAWSLYALAKQYPQYHHLQQVAHQHMNYSLANLIDDSYEGGHWLGSFAIYALLQQ